MILSKATAGTESCSFPKTIGCQLHQWAPVTARPYDEDQIREAKCQASLHAESIRWRWSLRDVVLEAGAILP